MYIAILCLEFHLEGCASLKEKRQRLGKLRDKFGKQTSIAVCESDYHDVLQSAQWSFVATSSDKVTVEKLVRQIDQYAASSLDAVISHVDLQWL